MAQNQSQETELFGILNDVKNHRFHYSRQVNSNSMLYRTAKYAYDQHYLENAYLDEPLRTLSSINFTQATLSAAGQAKLAFLLEKGVAKEEK
jgi:hypothetical protein